MSVEQLKHALQRPEAYRFAGIEPVLARDIHLKQTHLSLVFLTRHHVFKVKKPVFFGFVDFSSLELRRQACEAEIRLNRRLAPSVYLCVVPIIRCDGENDFVIGSSECAAEIVEYAVKMVRLPDEATLRWKLEDNSVDEVIVSSVAELLAKFHAVADRSEYISQFGSFQVVAGNVHENFEQTRDHVHNSFVSDAVYTEVKRESERQLLDLASLFQHRVDSKAICDAHGDLRLEHVYVMGDQIIIIDCIEFNERFRYSDALADTAFLYMDMCKAGRLDLAEIFFQAYMKFSSITSSNQDNALFSFYAAYRSVVRAKVAGFQALDKSVFEGDRMRAQERSRAHWLVALTLLRPPSARPALLIITGLPGTGKSTLSRLILAEHKNVHVEWIRSDEVRKEISSQQNSQSRASFQEGIYSSSMSQATYSEFLRRAREHIRMGHRVIADATFRKAEHLDMFRTMAQNEGALECTLMCVCSRDVVRQRLLRRVDDISDADWSIYEYMEKAWEVKQCRKGHLFEIRTECSSTATQCALTALTQVGLWQ